MSERLIVRKKLIFGLIVLLTMLPVSQGQDGSLPPCTSAQLSVANDVFRDYDVLTDAALEIETFDDLLIYSEIQIVWRVKAWAVLPLCAELHQLGVIMSRTSDAYISALLLQIIGVSREDNSYIEELYSGSDEYGAQGRAITALIESGQAPEDSSPGDIMPRCDDAQFQILSSAVVPVFQEQIAKGFEAFEAESTTEILRYINGLIGWRDKLWASLPTCVEAYHVGQFMFNFANDISKIAILDFAEVSRGANPYQSEFFRGFVRMSELLDWLDAGGNGYYNLLPCSESSIDIELYDVLKEQQNLAQSPGDAIDDLIAYGRLHIEWRERLWSHLPKLPACAEAFETALLSVQITGDGAAFTSIARILYDFLEIAQPYQDRVAAADNRLVELDSLLATMWKTESSPAAVGLPACPAAAIETAAGSQEAFTGLVDRGLAIETPDDLIDYIKLQFEWRDELWSALSGCAEVFDIALLMLQTAGDLAIKAAFDLAGVPPDDNPYTSQISHSQSLIEQWRVGPAEERAPSEEPLATKTYYVTADPYANIRSCASTSCSIVTTAHNGDALAIVDDSSDWYELQLEDGQTGYIAGFLLSKTPPSR